jgi:hypothetical protein
MFYNDKYWRHKGISSSQMTSQKWTVDSSPILKEPLLKKSFLTLMSTFQKDESVGFPSTRGKVLSLRYLLHKSCCHIPCSVSNLNSYLLSKRLFYSWSTSIRKPPWSFGWQIIFHFWIYISSYYHHTIITLPKKSWPKEIKHFLSPWGILRNESINIGTLLVNTRFISTSRSP